MSFCCFGVKVFSIAELGPHSRVLCIACDTANEIFQRYVTALKMDAFCLYSLVVLRLALFFLLRKLRLKQCYHRCIIVTRTLHKKTKIQHHSLQSVSLCSNLRQGKHSKYNRSPTINVNLHQA